MPGTDSRYGKTDGPFHPRTKHKKAPFLLTRTGLYGFIKTNYTGLIALFALVFFEPQIEFPGGVHPAETFNMAIFKNDKN